MSHVFWLSGFAVDVGTRGRVREKMEQGWCQEEGGLLPALPHSSRCQHTHTYPSAVPSGQSLSSVLPSSPGCCDRQTRPCKRRRFVTYKPLFELGRCCEMK